MAVRVVESAPGPTFHGLFVVGGFFIVWVTSAFIVPTAVVLYLTLGWWTPLAFLLCYYSYRIFFRPREWMAYRHFVQVQTRPYVRSFKLVFEDGVATPQPGQKALLAVHPHGILALGYTFMANSLEFFNSEIRWLVASSLFYFPFFADMLGWGNTYSASKESLLGFMKRGENIGLLPGGFQEATLHLHDNYRVYIKNRKGFIKYAMQYGYKIHPVFVFGEDKTYHTVHMMDSFRLWLNQFQIPGVIFSSRLGILPEPLIDVTAVVGPALELPSSASPTPQEVDEQHALYVVALEKLFNDHKAAYAAHPDAELVVM